MVGNLREYGNLSCVFRKKFLKKKKDKNPYFSYPRLFSDTSLLCDVLD